jgi:hypothetical protein
LCFDYIFLSTLQCYDFSRNSIPFLVCRSVDFDHVKPSLVHDFFWIKSIGKIQLEQFQNVLLVDVYKKCQNKSRKNWHSLTLDAFFEYMYKVWIILCNHIYSQFYFLALIVPHKFYHLLSLQREISTIVDVVVKFFYEKIFDNGKRSTIKLQEWMERVMDQVCKDHYFEFCKHLPMCDLGLGPNFLKGI